MRSYDDDETLLLNISISPISSIFQPFIIGKSVM